MRSFVGVLSKAGVLRRVNGIAVKANTRDGVAARHVLKTKVEKISFRDCTFSENSRKPV